MTDVPRPERPVPESGCSRREFLRRVGLAGMAAVGVTALGFGLHNRRAGVEAKALRLPDYGVPAAGDRPKIVAMRGDRVEEMLRACLDRLGGVERFIQRGDEVVLKPNVGFAQPPSVGATTNPAVVGAMARICLAAGAVTVWVVDNPINDPERCMKLSGIRAAAEEAGARVFLPRPSAFRDVEVPGNTVLKKWSFLHTPFHRATKVIGLPAAKHHSLAGATLGMKNWYGLLGGPRNQLHQDIHICVADLASMVRPTLTVLDATRVLFQNGPTGGSASDVREERTLALSVDPVALDSYGASLLGREPEEIGYIVEARRRGLGTTDLKAAGFEMLGGARVGGMG